MPMFKKKQIFLYSVLGTKLYITRSLPRKSILVPDSLFCFAGDEYKCPTLFVAQRAQIQLEYKENQKQL